MKKVFLVGAGPGDDGLITVKGLKCIQTADVIIYDNLVPENILLNAQDTAELIYVGKKINQHTLSQENINKLIIQKAQENKLVVRLKGGDPFVFGRGGEEALALTAAGIEFELVPGVSSPIAALAYAGIPITHRGLSSSFHVITGNEDPEKELDFLDYQLLAKLSGTLVFLMGLNNLEKICNQLITHGMSPNIPVAVVSKGTLPDQKVVMGTLETIKQKINQLIYPGIIVVGEVVKLREHLNWFEKKPLFGRKILVTRSRHQASILSDKIQAAGGKAFEFSTIEIVPSEDNDLLINMYNNLSSYDWLIFTSVNAVDIFLNKLKFYNKDIRDIGKAKIAAIGEATRNRLENNLLKVYITPDEYIAEALIEELKKEIVPGDKVLIPRAEVAREIIQESLEELEAIVDVIPLYKTVIANQPQEKLHDLLTTVDTICFASSSTVTNFISILGEGNINLLNNITVACIGPITANTAIDLGITSIIVAKEHTIDGLVNAIITNE